MNHTFTYCFFFLLFSFHSIGQQNLILNGDFEEYWDCPDGEAQIERCKYVFNPLPFDLTGFSSTSDCFNACFNVGFGGIEVGVPNTFEGFQNSKSGEGMLGFWSFDNFLENDHHREYIQLSFSEKLECGMKYSFEAYFNLSNYMRYSIKSLGFYFSEEELNEQDYLYNLYQPQYVDSITEISDTANWTKLTFEFVADKPYKFVSIGHTNNFSTSFYFEVNPNALEQSHSTYYFVDSVSLLKIEKKEILLPNVFTPNSDGINDIFQPIGEINFIENLIVLNRWGNIIANLSNPFQWDGRDQNGSEAINGVYYYRLNTNKRCKQEQKQGMIHLLR